MTDEQKSTGYIANRIVTGRIRSEDKQEFEALELFDDANADLSCFDDGLYRSREMREKFRNYVAEKHGATITNFHVSLDWSWPGVGFGQTAFYSRSGTLMCMNECMGPKSIRLIGIAAVEALASEAKLNEVATNSLLDALDRILERTQLEDVRDAPK